MSRQTIPFDKFNTRLFNLFDRQWMLLTAGDYVDKKFNAMTISWGSLGIMWNKPFIQVVVRPQRYTFEFIEQYPTFTVSAFPQEYHQALSLLGTRSGREGNKIAESRLTPEASLKVAAPCFVEAELVFECRKIYWEDFTPTRFLADDIDRHYPIKDYHRIYYGEIQMLCGTSRYVLS
jgi:flavin reductase (DIM6/NTAB) family NADH-FMN oxidoreductase RutF